MSAVLAVACDVGACWRCERRSWLLGQLSGPLDYVARDRGRLAAVLALSDAELMQAVGGRRRTELTARYEAFERARRTGAQATMACVCRHHASYPRTLCDVGAPALLNFTGGVRHLPEMTRAPVVAIVGSAAPSDYGIAIAGALARGLAASGVTVAGLLTDGIAHAAVAGALDGGGAPLAIAGNGLQIAAPIRHRRLLAELTEAGCIASELPPTCSGRRWGALAAERILARLAAVTVVVEAEDSTAGLAAARMAQARGAVVAAMPGRVTSRLSCGSHALLMEGAKLVRDAADVLEIVCTGNPPRRASAAGAEPSERLSAQLQHVLSQVGAGRDTPSELTTSGLDPSAVLLALTELEVLGLLRRGDGGRYVPTEPART